MGGNLCTYLWGEGKANVNERFFCKGIAGPINIEYVPFWSRVNWIKCAYVKELANTLDRPTAKSPHPAASEGLVNCRPANVRLTRNTPGIHYLWKYGQK